MAGMTDLLRPSELGQKLGLSTGHIYRMAAERRIPFLKIGGALRFDPQAIQRWLRAKEVLTVREVLRRPL